MKEIIVLGKGFLGKNFEKRGFEVWDKNRFYLRYDDVKDRFYFRRDDVNDQLSQLDNYNIIINCIGKSNTRWCEIRENFNEALFSNGVIPQILSQYCRLKNKKFVHISTGCLYDRSDIPQKEDDFIVAHCNYTVTKWVGEQNCDPSRDLILRPRLYFGDFEDRNNLLCKLPKFKRFLNTNNSYSSLDTIVDATISLLKADEYGIFNVACEGYAKTIELAEWIGLEGEELTEEELHKTEKLYLVSNIMDLSKLKKYFNPPKLREEVLRCYNKLKEK